MKSDLSDSTLVTLDKALSIPINKVVLTGKDLTPREILAVARGCTPTLITNDRVIRETIQSSYDHMMEDVKNGVPVYGCNTGYGARAEVHRNSGNEKERIAQAKKISESIVHTDISVGPEVSADVVRAAMLIRINMLVNGVSAVPLETLELYQRTLNACITPVVHAYGGIGASGDLAHNGRVVSALRQLPGVKVRDASGVIQEAKDALSKKGIPPLLLEPKAGLGLVNGDNFSTAAASLIVIDLIHSVLIADVLGAMVIEVLKGTNRTFHPFLSKVRPHEGQAEVADLYRFLLEGSKLAYQEMSGHIPRPPGVNVQDAYSLRCISQSEGLNREQIKWALKTITINTNSVSDNPLWVSPEYATPGEKPWQWVSGGNFFALYMGEVIDIMRKIMTKLIKRNDRHLHRLVTPHRSNGLPANLSDEKAISCCAFKGIQLQSGMFDVYSMLLAQPVTTMFGVHEESNQDITPHSLTSALLAWENLRVLRYSLAMNLLAVAQATDLRGGPHLLSPKTRPVYEFIRNKARYVEEERPLNSDVESIAQSIQDDTLIDHIRTHILTEFGNE